MKKIKLTLSAIVIGLITIVSFNACQKESGEKQISPKDSYLPKNPVDLVANTMNSVYMDYYNHFLSNDLGSITAQYPIYHSIDDTLQILQLKSNLLVLNSNVPKSVIVSHFKNNEVIDAYIIDYSSLIYENGNIVSGHVSFRLVNGRQVAKLTYVDDMEWIFDEPDDMSYAPWPSSGPGWWKCTADCYKWAKDVCDGDSECKLVCDLVDLGGGCTISVSVGCGIYCALNSTFVPPPLPEVINGNHPYGY
jgi:hypothetical protein